MPNNLVTDISAPFAVSVGDPAGIGPEIIGKAWDKRNADNLHCFFAVGDAASFAAHWKGPTAIISTPNQAQDYFQNALPILHIGDSGPTTPGIPTISGADIAFRSLKSATGLARSSAAGAIITAPVSKKQLYDVGFTHPGQTEFITEECKIAHKHAIMMLAGPSLRVVPITTHIALNDVAKTLTQDRIKNCIIATANELKYSFGIENPTIAMAGLNPHAGENGEMGDEEIKLLIPAIEQLETAGMHIIGPLSADTMFHAEARTAYDAALCCYHDQALIPLKTLYFHDAVNVTLGLPIIRTSPDHGTAFNIAGQNIARADSMIAAIKMAEKIALQRTNFEKNAHDS